MNQRMRALGKKLDLATYTRGRMVTFEWRSPVSAEMAQDHPVQVPLPIVYRLYHLGCAYDLHQLKHLHSNGRIAIDFLAVQLLIQEMEQVAALVQDPVVKHYGALLVSYLAARRAETSGRLVIQPSD